MYKMNNKKIIDYRTICVLIIISIFLFLFRYSFINVYNIFLEKILFVNDKKIYYSDNMLNEYIKKLETELSSYRNLTSLSKCVSSSIIYRNPNAWLDEVVINKGNDSLIKKNNMVINNNGLVGFINRVYNNSSSITLLTNISNDNLSVVINDNIYGTLSFYNKLDNTFIIRELPKGIKYTTGMKVYTSNYNNILPGGIYIGDVINIYESGNGLSNYALLKSNVDFNNLNGVCVLI